MKKEYSLQPPVGEMEIPLPTPPPIGLNGYSQPRCWGSPPPLDDLPCHSPWLTLPPLHETGTSSQLDETNPARHFEGWYWRLQLPVRYNRDSLPPSTIGVPPASLLGWNMSVNLHVVLCAWRQDHIGPVAQGLPFIQFISFFIEIAVR